MKTSNIIKAAAFVTAAAFTISSTGSYAGEVLLKERNSASIGEVQTPVRKAPAEAVIVEDGVTDIQKLNHAYENGSSERVAELCDSMIAGMEADKAEAEAVAVEISGWADDEIIARQQRYENELNVRYAETFKALTELKNGINPEENLAFINSEFAEPEEYHKSDAVPNIAVLPTEQTVSASAAESSAEIVSPAASADDLVYDKDVSDPAAIKELADRLGSAKDIYLFVKNSIANEAYTGSKKDPSITLEQLGGNDMDQAALLVALLRAKGIPARFMSGTVRITPEQAVELTGASDASSAGRLLAARYKNTARLNHNGQIVGYKMYHTWAEACIPYTDYRGAGKAGGESVWVQLDPSFKKVETVKQSVVPEYNDEDRRLLEIVKNGQEKFSGLYEKTDLSPESVDVYYRSLVACEDEYIPSSLPYTVLEADQRYSFIKDSDKASVSISVDGEQLLSESVSRLYGKPLIVSYEPASEYDREVIDRYEKITDVPAYLVNVVPVVTCGDVKSSGSMEISLGSVQKMATVINDGTGTTVLDDTVYAGSMYAINIDLQKISSDEAKAAEERIDAAAKDYSPEKTCTPEVLGSLLDYSGKYYFALCDSQSSVQSMMMNIDHSRQLGLAITGYQFHRRTSYGVVKSLEPGAFYIDVAYNSSYSINLDGDKKKEKEFNTAMGTVESYFEGYIWEQLIDKNETCISTVSVMQAALNKGISLRYITKSNLEAELAECNIAESVRREIRDFVNRGMQIEVVPETLTIGDWTGTAYIAYDMNTGSASYMISGGTAGGSSMDFEKLFEINNILSALNAEIALGSMVIGYTKFEVGQFTGNVKNTLEGAHSMIGAAFALGSAFRMRYDTYDFIFRYAEEGDDCLEDFKNFTYQNIFDTVVNIASLGGQLLGGAADTIISWVATIISTIELADEMSDEDASANDKFYDAVALIWDLLGKVAF